MRALLIALLLTAATAVPASAATRTVRIGDDWFVRAGDPATVTVATGTVVRWRWTGRNEHNVLVRSGPRSFRSAFKESGSYRKRMRRRGTYRIVCANHRPGMRMTLKVR